MRRSSMLLNTQLRDLLTLAKGEAGRLADPRRAVRGLRAGRERSPLGRSRAGDLQEACSCVVDASARAAVRGRRRRAHRPGADQPGRQLDPLHRRGRGPGLDGAAGRSAGRPARFVVADTGPGIPDGRPAHAVRARQVRHHARPARRRLGHRPGDRPHAGRPSRRHAATCTASWARERPSRSRFRPSSKRPTRRSFADTDTHGRVLVVDDRSDVLDALESVIDELGYELDRAGSAAAATRLALGASLRRRAARPRHAGSRRRRSGWRKRGAATGRTGRRTSSASSAGRAVSRRPIRIFDVLPGQADRPVGAAPRAARRPPPGTAGPGGSLADGRLSDRSRRSEVDAAHHLLHRDRLG